MFGIIRILDATKDAIEEKFWIKWQKYKMLILIIPRNINKLPHFESLHRDICFKYKFREQTMSDLVFKIQILKFIAKDNVKNKKIFSNIGSFLSFS